MNVQGLIAKIFGFIVIIVVLALAPSITTANATIVGDNLTNLIGMSVMSGFGAPLMIIMLLFGGGMFAIAGIRGNMAGASLGDMLQVVWKVVLCIVALTMFDSIIDYTNTLIGVGATTFATTIYGIIPLVIYLLIIGLAGVTAVSAYKAYKGGGRRGRRAVAAGF